MPLRRYLQVPAAGQARPPARSPVSAWLLRPYLELEPAPEHAPIHATTTYLAGKLLLAGDERPLPMQINTDSCFRELLRLDLGPRCALADPREVPDAARTESWRRLCERVDAWAGLSPAEQMHAATLLGRLGFFALTQSLVGESAAANATGSVAGAELYLAYLNSRFKSDGASAKPVVEGLARIASTAPEPRLRLRVALFLVVHFARVRPDGSEIEGWCRKATAELVSLRPDDDPCDLILRSAYHRAVAFLPFVRGDRPRVADVMRACEEDAYGAVERALAAGDPVWLALARENLHPALETAAKAAEWSGDPERALDYRQRFIALDPGEPKGYLRLGDALLRRGQADAAGRAYLEAAALGAPSTAQAWFMAGVCRDQTGNFEGALDAYLCAAEAGPFELEAIKRVGTLASRLDQPSLATWCRARETNVRAWIQAGARRASAGSESEEVSAPC